MSSLDDDFHLVFDTMHKHRFRMNVKPVPQKQKFKPNRQRLRTQIQYPKRQVQSSLADYYIPQTMQRKKSSLEKKNKLQQTPPKKNDNNIFNNMKNFLGSLVPIQEESTAKRMHTDNSEVRRERNITWTSRKSNKTRSQKLVDKQQQKHKKQMQRIKKHIKEQKIYDRLSVFALENTKLSLRVYRQDYQKLFTERYGKDRITSFLDFQYIEDFDSISKTLEVLLKMKRQQMLLFTFLIVDSNKDGLISTSDLLHIAGVKNNHSSRNKLVEKDVFKIVQAVREQRMDGKVVMDIVSDDIILEESLSLTKYRIYKYKQNKAKSQQNNISTKLNHYNMHKNLFSLRKRSQDEDDDPFLQKGKSHNKNRNNNLIKSVLTFLTQKNSSQAEHFFEKKHFQINFDHYCRIFQGQTPFIFIDFLYVLGGVVVDEYERDYEPLSFFYLIEAIMKKKPPPKKEEDKALRYKRQLLEMKEFKEQLKTVKQL